VHDGRAQVGRATSGTWSPILKRSLALASVAAVASEPGTRLEMEWSVEGERGRLGATVTSIPFYDPPRKRG
jgi:aminomethyltransferase